MEYLPIIAFFILFVIMAFFALGSAILIYHFARFRFSKEHHRLLISAFVFVSIAFVIIELALFFAIDWETIQSLIENQFQNNPAL